jgi:type IV secretory pathway TrbL component
MKVFFRDVEIFMETFVRVIEIFITNMEIFMKTLVRVIEIFRWRLWRKTIAFIKKV